MRLKLNKIYLDTNIFDILTKNDYRRKDTEGIFSEIENGKFEAYYSQTAVEEILQTKNKEQKFKLKDVLEEKIIQKKCIRLLPINNEIYSKIYKLVDTYQIIDRRMVMNFGETKLIWKESIFAKPGSQTEDRWHIAIAVINKLDAFVTWDTELMNQNIKVWINKINRKLGYSEIEIFTPSRLIKNSKYIQG